MCDVCMYEKVATVTVSIEETVSLGQGERVQTMTPYFPKQVCDAQLTRSSNMAASASDDQRCHLIII